MGRAQRGDRRGRGQTIWASRPALGPRGHDDGDRRLGGDRAHQAVSAFDRTVHDLGIDSEAVALLLHRLTATGDCVGERRRCPRDRTGDVSPVVGQEGEMHDTVPSRRNRLRGAQDQIVILRSIEVGAKPADLAHDIAPQRRQMACVHRRPEPLGRPVRFQEMSGLAPVGQNVCLVAVDVVDVGRGIDRRGHPLERSWHQPIVVIEQRDELAAGHRQRIVRGGDDSAVGCTVHDTDSWIASCQIVEQRAYLWPRRAIVDDAPLPIAERLRQHAVDACQERPEWRIVDRRDDRESGTDGRRC